MNTNLQTRTQQDRRLPENAALRQYIDSLSQQSLYRLAFVDALTGLHNRAAYEQTEQLDYQCVIDLDNFKWYNDYLGHSYGDSILCDVGYVLSKHGGEHAYRFGGDELVIQANTLSEMYDLLQKIENDLLAINKSGVNQYDPNEIIVQQGIKFSYGIGQSFDAADAALLHQKAMREQHGSRAKRGEQPNNITRIPTTRLA